MAVLKHVDRTGWCKQDRVSCSAQAVMCAVFEWQRDSWAHTQISFRDNRTAASTDKFSNTCFYQTTELRPQCILHIYYTQRSPKMSMDGIINVRVFCWAVDNVNMCTCVHKCSCFLRLATWIKSERYSFVHYVVIYLIKKEIIFIKKDKTDNDTKYPKTVKL